MNFDFAAFLLFTSLGTGLIALADILYFKPKRLAAYPTTVDKPPVIIEYARSFFPVLFIVLILRSFWMEPYRIPSGSMKPTLLVGDFILVNKYAYGLRLPVLNNKVYSVGEPQRGDVMVFRFPVDPSVNFIKRVVGLPGDVITYKNKSLYVNNELVTKESLGQEVLINDYKMPVQVYHWREQLANVEHDIYERAVPGREVVNITVPAGNYFMMGDNRDDSNDSRGWGFVPEENIVGKAIAVWFSWDNIKWWIRTEGLPRWIK